MHKLLVVSVTVYNFVLRVEKSGTSIDENSRRKKYWLSGRKVHRIGIIQVSERHDGKYCLSVLSV